MGNITKVYENGDLVTEYKYDATNRLARENNKALGKTYVFLYDNKGNILSKKEYPFTLKCDEYLEELNSINTEYTYSNNKLISFSNEKIEYNAVGSPTIYRNNELTWRFGKQLTSYGANTFDYDAEGKRISKNYIQYVYDIEGKLYEQDNGVDNIVYFYDNNSSIVGFSYNSMMCLYKKDLLGNIIEILDTSGNTMVKYTYDAWGNHTITDYTEFGLGSINPFRYRSYYYDTETGLYYLKSRYYDPQTGRFISMDDISYLDPETIGGANLYAYCLNDPVNKCDTSGHLAISTFIFCLGIGIALGAGIGASSANQQEIDLWRGILTGAMLGGVIGAAVGFTLAGISGGIARKLGVSFLTGGLKSFYGKFSAELTAYTIAGKKFSSIESYMSVFVFGGIVSALGLNSAWKFKADVLLRPAYSILVDDMLFKGTPWSQEKYLTNVAIRWITSPLPNDLKPLFRGMINGLYYKYNSVILNFLQNS
ncbi:MAG: hypothetical protein II984_09980 [Clostridia bacterium]|nr:hypothetical protein [Clostridia bacterium]